MNKQLYRPTDIEARGTVSLRTLGLDHPDGIVERRGKSLIKHQVSRQDTFALVAIDSLYAGSDHIGYTRQEDYVKISFWLSGRHTTVLDGFGQHDHDRPEVFITSGPLDMVKVDLLKHDSPICLVSLCLLREFFPLHMGIAPEEVPQPLRDMILPDEKPYGFCSFPLTADIVAAARAILSVPATVRRDPLYAHVKAVELMLLLFNQMNPARDGYKMNARARPRREARLHEARELLTRQCGEAITLEGLSKAVGLNRVALTSGFRQLFGMSVYDCLHKERMTRAYQLLQDPAYSIGQVAEAVGYGHSCNFSTSFRAYFGCSPRAARNTSG